MNESKRVLVVEDDAAINDIVCTRLARDGLEVTSAFSGSEAVLLLERETYHAVVCDLMLPGMSGEEVVARVRKHDAALPILIISAKTTPADKVGLLQMGADDYLGKPFDLDELAARVQVQLRRGTQGTAPGVEAIHCGAWKVDMAARTLTAGGAEVPLTRTEFAIASLLAQHPGRVFTKQELFEHAWGEPYAAQESTVAAHVSNLRTKLKASGTDDYIQTVWGIGFKLAIDG